MKAIVLVASLFALMNAWADGQRPWREISIIVAKEGYYPKNITVFQGERIKFYVTATVDAPDCLVLQGHKVFLSATRGKIAEGETTFENAGTFAFYCPATKHDGKITVIKKDDHPGRRVAGDMWVPKEYD